MNILTDDDLMPNGLHKGKKMSDVPADYLLWVFANNKCSDNVRAYIQDVKEALETEAKQNDYEKRI